MKTIENVWMTHFAGGRAIDKEDSVMVEFALQIRVNGSIITSMPCTPASLEELVIGFLFGEGMIGSADDITEIRMDEDKGVADVHVAADPLPDYTDLPPLPAGFTIPASRLLEQVGIFNQKSGLFASTGGAHSCCLCAGGRILYFEEDISRHNAVDKVVGHALTDRMNLSDTILIKSGRAPSDMCLKAVKAKIPIMVTRGAVTDAAITAAKRYNLTLAGFARNGKMNIYSGSQRILM